MLKYIGNIFLFILLFITSSPLTFAQTSQLEIWQIQGTGSVSPYAGEEVLTAPAVVTAVGEGFFFLQSPDERADTNTLTSNGIYVHSTQAGNRKVGDLIQVKGTVLETENRTQIGQGSVQVTFIESGSSLPAPVVLNRDFPSGMAMPVPEMEAVEGMRIQFSGTATGPSDYPSMLPVVAREQRPFREPGIEYPGKANLPVWDGNPEIFWMLPNALSAPNNRFISAGTSIQASGPLFQLEEEYILFPETYTLGPGPTPRAVKPADPQEITVGSLNVRRLEETRDDFNQHARKVALYIKEMLRAPDLLAIQEIGSASALSTLRFYLQQLDPDLDYSPFFLAGNDDINLAYLARSDRFTDIQVEQLGKLETMPGGGILFDRPPLLFRAALTGRPDVSLQVINVHLRSLLGIEGNNESFVREKRHRQAIALAEMARDLRDENLLILGDFNAYAFSDGYVDVVNQVTGENSLGAQYSPVPIVTPPLSNLSREWLPETERYSYVFRGTAQQIDHALAGSLDGLEIRDMQFARANADFPDAYAPNDQIVQRASDHDGFVIYLATGQPNAISSQSGQEAFKVFPNPARAGNPIFLELPEGVRAHISLHATNGQIISRTLKQSGDKHVNIFIEQPGQYFLFIRTEKWFRSEKMLVLPTN